MVSTSARLLDLISLLQQRREWSGRDLADRLEIDIRTVRRDIGRLRELGYPVEATPGVAGGYRLGAGADLPPLLLDDEEAVAVAVGLRTVAGRGVRGVEEKSVSALAKLETVLPSRLRRRVSALGDATVPTPGSAPGADPQALIAISAACRDSERLRFAYASAAGETTRRLVEPCRLVHTGYRWYLVAFDCDRDDWRTFRVDRIEGTLTPDRRFEPRDPPADDLAAYVADRVREVRNRWQARVILNISKDEALKRVPYRWGTLEAIGDDRCELRTAADWLGGLAVYIAEIGADFEVVEPPELKQHVKGLAERFARASVA